MPTWAKPKPLHLYSSGHFGIPLEIDGEKVLTLWDTGAGLTMVDPDFAKAHPQSIQPVGMEAHGTDLISGKPLQITISRLLGAKVDGFDLQTLLVGLHNLELARNIQPQVLIGFNLIHQLDWAIDLRRGQWAATR